MVGKILMMQAFDDCDKKAPSSAYILFLYGNLLFFGRGGFREDVEGGVKWVCRAAEMGYAPARRLAGAMVVSYFKFVGRTGR